MTELVIDSPTATKILAHHQPRIIDCSFREIVQPSVQIPPISSDEITSFTTEADRQNYLDDIAEWLALVSLESPRISANDDIDPYLSRYAVPEHQLAEPPSSSIVRLQWHGLIPPAWTTQLFIRLL
jgi:ribonuclease P/MRP protein subunit RPP40